jgi:tRNA (mo5U34)-methyltransferase
MANLQHWLRTIPRPIRAVVPPSLRRAIKSALPPDSIGAVRERDLADPELVRRVAAIRWFHTMELGNGLITPGIDDTPDKLRRLHLPASFAGQSVLDIGAWDGFFSFEAERRGAADVLALDGFVWKNKTWGSKAGFELARQLRQSRVRDLELDVMEISPESTGSFDVVFFLGVFYHLFDPILALQRIAAVTRRMLILETEAAFSWSGRSLMHFFPGGTYNRDSSNWWVPTPAAVRDLLREVGFSRVQLVDRCTVNWWPWTGRVVFHAYK